MRIDFHPEATAELDSSVDWYLKQSLPAAQAFAQQIERALIKISADPQRFAVVATGFRACSVENFPYQVVFRVDPHRILVVAVAHAKRRPGYWRSRA